MSVPTKSATSDPAVVAAPVGLAQLLFGDLAYAGARQRVDEPHQARLLVAREVLGAIVDNLFLPHLRARLQHDGGADRLAPLLVRNAEYRGVADRRVRVE